MHKLHRLGIALAVVTALTAGATPSMAATATAGRHAPKACSEETYYTVKSKQVVSYWVPGTNFVDGKGGTVQGRVDKAWTKSATVEKSADVSVGVLWATVKAQVSKSATKSNTVTVGHWYTHSIPRNKYGHIRYRVIGYKILFWKMREQRNCKVKFLDAFYGTFPTDKEGWKYWSSTRP